MWWILGCWKCRSGKVKTSSDVSYRRRSFVGAYAVLCKSYLLTTSLTISLHSVIAPIPAFNSISSKTRHRGALGALTDIAARERFADWAMDLVPEILLHHLELLRGERVREHVRVHRGKYEHGDEGRQRPEEGRLPWTRISASHGWCRRTELRECCHRCRG